MVYFIIRIIWSHTMSYYVMFLYMVLVFCSCAKGLSLNPRRGLQRMGFSQGSGSKEALVGFEGKSLLQVEGWGQLHTGSQRRVVQRLGFSTVDGQNPALPIIRNIP